MRVSFVKMHGLGNDFVVLDARGQTLPPITPALAAALANRHTGIGCDQLIVLEPATEAGRARSADFRMRIFNADGFEVEACGNATRAVGLLEARPGRNAVRIETLGGMVAAALLDDGSISALMGLPRFLWSEIPLAYAMDTLSMPVGWDDLNSPSAVNVGNPHVVFFVPDCDAVELDRLGPLIENDPLFPERVNVNVATVVSREAIRLRVWERGAGLTQACGTGACATAVAAMRRGLTERTVSITQAGGDLKISWKKVEGAPDLLQGVILMTGPAAISFTGSFDPADYGA